MNSKRKIRVFSADDHPLLREGIAAIINNQDDMVMVAQASNGREAIQLFREHQPDVTLMDLRMPDISGIDALSAILGEFPDARIVMLTTFEGDVEIQRSLAAGARGYLLKNMPPNDLVEVVRQVHAGRKRIPQEIAAQLAEHIADERLTDREIDVLQHVAGGNRNRDIAESLSISEETVKVHMKHIMEKLGRPIAPRQSQSPSAGASSSCDCRCWLPRRRPGVTRWWDERIPTSRDSHEKCRRYSEIGAVRPSNATSKERRNCSGSFQRFQATGQGWACSC